MIEIVWILTFVMGVLAIGMYGGDKSRFIQRPVYRSDPAELNQNNDRKTSATLNLREMGLDELRKLEQLYKGTDIGAIVREVRSEKIANKKSSFLEERKVRHKKIEVYNKIVETLPNIDPQKMTERSLDSFLMGLENAK